MLDIKKMNLYDFYIHSVVIYVNTQNDYSSFNINNKK